MRRGALLVLEGAEGVGKTTQLRRLATRLSALGVKCVTYREPGGSALGDAVREMLLDRGARIAPAAEALLFMASRAQLVSDGIRAALDESAVVLLDRFFLSTYAYQVAGRGLPEIGIRAANSLATGGLVPDLTLLLELPGAEGLTRADARGARDRMECADDAFHRRVAVAFAEFADPEWQVQHPECGPIVRVSATGSEDVVFERIVRRLIALDAELFGGLDASAQA